MKRGCGAIGIMLLAAACGRRTPADMSALVGQKFQEAVPKVEAALGIPFKTPPKFEIRSREQVRAFVAAQLDDSVARAQLAGEEAAFKALGLVPDTLSLEKLVQTVLDEQIAGYYDPKTDVLYVVEDATEEIMGITVTHELVHALQDQYLDLDSLQRIRGDDDAQMAAQALIEGQATYEQMHIMLGDQVNDMLPEVWTQTRELIRGEHASMPVFAASPLAIQELLLFPYLSGAQFVHDASQRVKVEDLFSTIPRSTEQILHPGTYARALPDWPTRVTVPAPRQGQVIYNNTVGEFVTRLFLYQWLQQPGPASEFAAGWDGDRLLIVDTPKGRGIVWASVWDTAIDSDEFSRAMERVAETRYAPMPPHAVTTGPLTGTRYTMKGRDVTITSGTLKSRPFVLFIDVPEGTGVTVDVAGIRLDP